MPRGKRAGGSEKRTFVLSQPADMPAKEVVEKARQQGIRLKEHYVYVVRSNARLENKKAANAAAVNPRVKGVGSPESQFRRLALELGLDKSKQLLSETARKIADVIEGR